MFLISGYRYDSDLLLQHPLPLRSSTEPETKRAKLSGDASETSNIESRINSGEYNSIQELVNDIESASKLVIEQHQRNDASMNGFTSRDQATTATDIVNRTAAFKKHVDNFLRRTSLKDISQVKSEPQDGKDETSLNGYLKRTQPREDGGTVLTLYGNSANPKQLFSSLKRPTKVNLQPHDSDPMSSVEIQTPLNETRLPNGISASKVVPHNDTGLKSKNKTRTIGETFLPRSTLPPLEPLRKGKQTHKSSTVTWVDWLDVAAESKSRPNERGSYNLAPLPAGQWLHYGGTATNSNPNGVQQENGDVRQSDGIDQRQLTDDKSLFQSVYSSFAPSFDSSGAIIPEDAKDQMWWNKLGEKRFRTFLSLQYPEDELTGSTSEESAAIHHDLDEDTLEEAVNSYVQENEFPEIPKPENSNDDIEDKDMAEVLNEIGELLETLNSYNRIRHLAPPGSRPGNESTAGTPDIPSAAEITIYETLKASLSAMIATLPPYAVAKLSGEQLSDLNISKKMLVENVDYHGTMEVDDYTAQQRHASRITSTAAASRTPAPNMGSGSRSNSYQSPAAPSSYNQRPISSNPRSHQTPRGYPSQQAYGARQPQQNHYPPNIAPQNYQASRQPASTPQRPPHGTQKYPQSASSQYGSQGSTLQQFQRSSQNGVGRYSPQQGHLPAHNSPQQYQQRPTQPGYPPRAPEGAYNTPLAAGRSASPQKPPSYSTPQSHSPFLNSTSSAQQRYIHPQQQPHHQMAQQPHPLHHYNNFPPSRTPPMPNNVPNSASIAAAMPYQRSAAEQAALMDRNKTQLDVHQQRQGSNTPQPSQAMSPLPSGAQPRTESMQEMNYTPISQNQQNGMTNVNAGGNH